jgi:hypothetical protein
MDYFSLYALAEINQSMPVSINNLQNTRGQILHQQSPHFWMIVGKIEDIEG